MDPIRGRVIDPPNLGSSFHDIPLAERVVASLGLPAFLDRDTQVAALGETSLFEFAQGVLTQVNYRAELDRVYKTPGDIEARLASIQEFLHSLALYEQRTEGPTLAGLLAGAPRAGRAGPAA